MTGPFAADTGKGDGEDGDRLGWFDPILLL